MAPAVKSEAPPITVDADGTMRVGGTRVLLDLVVIAFQQGSTPEQIVRAYDSLKLADVYAVIAYYLRHTAEVDKYIADGEVEAEALRKKIEAAQPDMSEFRARLRLRRKT